MVSPLEKSQINPPDHADLTKDLNTLDKRTAFVAKVNANFREHASKMKGVHLGNDAVEGDTSYTINVRGDNRRKPRMVEVVNKKAA